VGRLRLALETGDGGIDCRLASVGTGRRGFGQLPPKVAIVGHQRTPSRIAVYSEVDRSKGGR
jgi:hypothetical protein